MNTLLKWMRVLVWNRAEIGRFSFSSEDAPGELRARLLNHLNAHSFRFQLEEATDDSVTYSDSPFRRGSAGVVCRFRSSAGGTTMEIVVSRTETLLPFVLLVVGSIFLLPALVGPALVWTVAVLAARYFTRTFTARGVADQAAEAAGIARPSIDFDGPPCPYCGKPLLSDATRQCLTCHASWHPPRAASEHSDES